MVVCWRISVGLPGCLLLLPLEVNLGVCGQLRRQAKSFAALGAGMFFLISVNPKVTLQGESVGMFFAADVALKRTDLVSLFVVGQATSVPVTAAAYVAFEFPFLFLLKVSVHVLQEAGHAGTNCATLFAREACRPDRVLRCHHVMMLLRRQDTERVDVKAGNTSDDFSHP